MHFFKKAGYVRITPLQRFCIPLILKGKNLAIEAGERTGKTAALILPIISRYLRGKGGIKAVVLVPDVENAKKVSREIKKFIGTSSKNDPYLVLGLQDGGKNDYRLLQKKPKIIIGTTEKIIDHIRRGNLDFSSLKVVAANVPPVKEVSGFIQDVFFIQSKIPRKTQYVFTYSGMLSEIDELTSSISTCQIINRDDWDKFAENTSINIVEVSDERKKIQAIYDLFYGKLMTNLVIQNTNSLATKMIQGRIKKHKINIKFLSKDSTLQEKNSIINEFNNHRSKILIIDDIKIKTDRFLHSSHLIFYNFTYTDPKALEAILHGMTDLKEVIFLTTPMETKKIQMIKENLKMSIENSDYPKNEDIFKGYIKSILNKIKESESIEDLEKYKKIYKKNVPIFMRPFFTAYLLKESNPDSKKRRTTQVRSRDGGSMTTMFVSIGKNRRVFPKDLAALFMSNLKLKKSEIREIKVLDSYSFVDIPSHFGKEAIAKLSGMDYKGRKITVNFARKRERSASKN